MRHTNVYEKYSLPSIYRIGCRFAVMLCKVVNDIQKKHCFFTQNLINSSAIFRIILSIFEICNKKKMVERPLWRRQRFLNECDHNKQIQSITLVYLNQMIDKIHWADIIVATKRFKSFFLLVCRSEKKTIEDTYIILITMEHKNECSLKRHKGTVNSLH